ncbi:MAG TPA: M23 family metallopeptidase [Rhodopila sp.]|nr:M23 family metallopeptidase [Rhodopila sp.]
MLMPAARLSRVTSPFGMRHDGFHPGVDLAAPYGSPVRAALTGTVTYAGRYSAYGNVVDLRSTDGIETRYAHLSRIEASMGEFVRQGQTLGTIGMTGNARGPHLHFEVIVGSKPVNPAPFLALTPMHRESPIEVEEAPPPTRVLPANGGHSPRHARRPNDIGFQRGRCGRLIGTAAEKCFSMADNNVHTAQREHWNAVAGRK